MTGVFRVGRSLRAAARAAGARVVAVVAVVLALFVAISGAASAMAATAIIVGGLGATQLSDSFMKQALGGKFDGTDPVSGTTWQREDVMWPAQAGPILGKIPMGQSVSVGTQNMLDMIKTAYAQTGGAITVFGMSEGSAVVDEVMRALLSDSTAPPPSAVNFIVAGDANHRQAGFIPHTYGGYKFQRPAVTPYNLTVVTYEYDGWSDWPDNLWNWTAARNALAGALLLHNKSYYVDLSTVPVENVTTKRNESGGYTTYYLVPTETLPLVLMIPRLAPREEELKKKVDAAYGRNNQVKAGVVAAVAPPSSASTSAPDPTSVDSGDTVAPQAAADPPQQGSSSESSDSQQGSQTATEEDGQADPQTAESTPGTDADAEAVDSDDTTTETQGPLRRLRDRLGPAAEPGTVVKRLVDSFRTQRREAIANRAEARANARTADSSGGRSDGSE